MRSKNGLLEREFIEFTGYVLTEARWPPMACARLISGDGGRYGCGVGTSDQ